MTEKLFACDHYPTILLIIDTFQQQHKKLRFQALMDDLKNTSSSQLEERKYLENELIKINKSPPSYFKDPWNVIDIITYITLGVLIVLHAVDIGVHRVQLALWTARFVNAIMITTICMYACIYVDR